MVCGPQLSSPSATVPPPQSCGYTLSISPTVLREGPFRLFFFSREEPRVYVRVSHPDGEAKFWLTPDVALADAVGLTARQLAEAQDIVERHTGEIRDAWIRQFGA